MRILMLSYVFLFWVGAFAANEGSQSYTLDGILYQKGTTSPLLDSSINLKIQILNPSGTCLLYEETQTVSTLNSKGYFNIQVGSETGSSKRSVNDPGRTMAQIFQNLTAIGANSVPGQTCSGSSYLPSAGDVRYFRITVTPSTTMIADALSPDIVLDSVPQAIVAQSLQGLERANILTANTASGVSLNQLSLESLFTGSAWTNLQSILSGNFMRVGTSGATLPSYATTPSGVTSGQMWYDSTTNQVKYQSNSGVQTIGTSTGGVTSLTVASALSVNGAVAGTISSGAATIDLSNTGVTAGTYAKVTVDTKGRVTAGAVSLTEAELPVISTAGKVSGNAMTSGVISGTTSIATTGNLVTSGVVSGTTVQASNLRVYSGAPYVQLTAQAMSSSYSLALPTADGISGQVLSTNGGGSLNWTTPSAGIAGTISIGQGGTAATSFSSSRIIASNSTGSALVSFDCSLNQVISFDASGMAQCSSVSSLAGTGLIANGGNTTGAAISIGSNDNQPLQIKTNNSVAMTISQGGNVGIGTTTPSNKLSVTGSGDFSTDIRIGTTSNPTGSEISVQKNKGSGSYVQMFMQNTNAGGGTGFGVQNNGSSAAFLEILGSTYSTGYSSEVSGAAVLFAIGTNLSLVTHNSYPIQFWTNEIERMRVDSSGNFGIGTTIPSSALDVSGAFTSRGMSSAPSVSSSNQGRIYYDYGTNKFKVSENGGAYQNLVGSGSGDFKSDGSVAMTGQILMSNGSSSAPALSFSGDTDTGIASGGVNYISFVTGGTHRMGVDSSGNFGSPIGHSFTIQYAGYNQVNPPYAFNGDQNSGMFGFANGSSGSLGFSTNSVGRLFIDSAGKVGVGISNPSYNLDVVGSLHITGTPYRDSGDIAWTVPSDARLKDVVGKYENGLNQILNIETIRYHYKSGNARNISSIPEYTGVLAQNVQQTIPEAVNTDDQGYLSLNTTPIFWAMVNAIQDLYRQIVGVDEKLRQEIDQKNREIQELKSYLCLKDPQAPFCLK